MLKGDLSFDGNTEPPGLLGNDLARAIKNMNVVMLLDAIRAELARLQVHAVNLGVELKDDRLVALRGSLLRYWKLPPCLDGPWLLEQLQALPDKAGPEAAMNGLVAAFADESKTTQAGSVKTRLRLFDPQRQVPEKRQAAIKKER